MVRGVPLIPQTVGPSEGTFRTQRDAPCSEEGVVATLVHCSGVLRRSGVERRGGLGADGGDSIDL